jgi:hypothetical protein
MVTGQFQTHSVNLSQRLFLTASSPGLLQMPIASIDKTLESIAQDPEKFNKSLQQNPSKGNGSSTVRVIGPNIPNQQNPGENVGESLGDCKKGLIPWEGVDSIIERVELKPEDLIDGIYSFEGNAPSEKPHFEAYKNLIATPPSLEMIQIPKEFKTARSFYNFLLNRRNWMAKTMAEVYNILGNRQREFIGNLKPASLNIFTLKDLSGEQGYSETTFSRLLRNRFVAIRHEGKDYVLPTCFLCPNQNDFLFYSSAEKLNDAFKQEFIEHTAISDLKLADSSGIKRRTFSKYRDLAGIPTLDERQKAYASNQVQEPYKVVTSVEKFLLDPSSIMTRYISSMNSPENHGKKQKKVFGEI